MFANQPTIRVFSGICPDETCKTKLYFPSYSSSNVECTGCGKHFTKDALVSVKLIEDSNEAVRSLLRTLLLTNTALKKGSDLVKVRGYSNYHCRILSTILTYYGMEKTTSRAKLLREMGQGDFFDCAHVGDRSFSIESEYIDTPGYGKDKSGALAYLEGLFEEIKLVNNNEERLVPLHVDGDGYCLVHAISRALVGREIFWHALMVNLQDHLKKNLPKYKNLFADFISLDEWDLIIAEADPEFKPEDDQPLGLRNIHIFGLANVLHRPILLLDSVSGIQSSADYSGTFLPALVPVHLCKNKDGSRIPPLAIAWSSSARNHYIPLVCVKDKQLAKIPSWVIPKAWGIPNELIKAYIDFDDKEVCVIGGTKRMSDAYLTRLMKAMDEKFLEVNKISAMLVTEVHQFIFKPSGLVGIRPKTVLERTRQAVDFGVLLRCLSCKAISEFVCPVNKEWLLPGGSMYQSAMNAAQAQGGLTVGEMYSFPEHDVICSYNTDTDELEVAKYKGVDINVCVLCKGSLRKVKADGSPIYYNGDKTTSPSSGMSSCPCGFKHFWDGKEYDNQPELLPVSVEWGGTTIKDKVHWFQYESDPSLNSNVYAVAEKLVQKYFPGEFGSERLVQKVVDTILRQTAKKEGENKGARPDIPNLDAAPPQSQDPLAYCPSKIILTGQKKKTFHKEELNMSDAEKRVKMKTEHHAVLTQNRQTKLQKAQEKSPTKLQSPKQEPSPSSPRPTSSQAPRNNKRIRLSPSTGGQRDLILPLDVTYNQLQEAIEKELGVPPKSQKIRFGFPPRVLNPPEEGKEQDPIPVQHGERVMVEVLPSLEPEPQPNENEEIQEENKMDVAGAMGGESKENVTDQSPMDVDVDTAALATALMSALSGAMPNGDMWEMACRSPYMFNHGGYYYNMAVNSLGQLNDGQHCTFPNLPNKVFVFNQSKDRLDLCLGDVHIPVQPINQETLAAAHGQQSHHSPQSSVLNTESSFSGAITHRGSGRKTMAFTGEGRSLVDPPSPRQQEKQEHSKSETSTSTKDEATSQSQNTNTEDQTSCKVTMETNDENIAIQVPKTHSSDTKQGDGVVAMETQHGDDSSKQTEVPASLQSSGTASIEVVDLETNRDDKSEISSESELSPHMAKPADVPITSDVERVVSPETMEVETDFSQKEPRDHDSNTNAENPNKCIQEDQPGIARVDPRDNPRDHPDEDMNTDSNVNNSENMMGIIPVKQYRNAEDDPKHGDNVKNENSNIKVSEKLSEDIRDDQAGISRDNQPDSAESSDKGENSSEVSQDCHSGISPDQKSSEINEQSNTGSPSLTLSNIQQENEEIVSTGNDGDLTVTIET